MRIQINYLLTKYVLITKKSNLEWRRLTNTTLSDKSEHHANEKSPISLDTKLKSILAIPAKDA